MHNHSRDTVQTYPTPRSALTPAQRALLEKRLRGASTRTTEIPRRADDGPAPLSFAQQRMWFYAQLEPDRPTYNIPISVTLTGPLNIAALEDSLNAIVQRHAVLRTRFTTVGDEPIQIIAPTLHIPLTVIHTPALSEAEVENSLTLEARIPFNLTQGPLLRARLLRFTDTQHILQLTFHHSIFDGWSLGIFFRELGTFYTAHITGKAPTLPALPIQYADFAVWQREWLQGKKLQQQFSYWKQQLSGALPILNLPTDRPRPPIQTSNGALYHFTFPRTLYTNIQRLAQQEGVSLFMLLLAAFEMLLYRYTGQTDISIGIPIANRTHSELEELIGFFSNTLVLRVDLSANPSFHTLLARVRQSALAAYEHQDLPFEQLVEALQPERVLSRTPLFQVMCSLENTSEVMLKLHNVEVAYKTLDNQTALFDLSFDIQTTLDGVTGSFEYNTDLFDASTIQRMAVHLNTLLENAIAHPDQPITTLPIMPAGEQRQTLKLGHGATLVYLNDLGVHHLFEAQAAHTPNALALISEERQLTYSALNQQSNQLAHYLQSLGVGPETLVGLCIERTPEMIVSLLGILKAGGMYVPLDPIYPDDRLTLLLSDTQTRFLITQQHMANKLPIHPEHVICVDTDWDNIAQHSQENPNTDLVGTNGAYIIYTSGSTGVPKGVVTPHNALRNFIIAANADYRISAGERVLQFASVSFDAAAEEIYLSLAQGATLVLRTDEMLSSAAVFWRTCEALRINVLDLPTAYWRELVNEFAAPAHIEVSLPPMLRLVIIGGEKASLADIKAWHTHVSSQVQLINGYGPTETTVAVTTCDLSIPEALIGAQENAPIGHSIANVHTYVLDSQLQPVPVSVFGELYIGGSSLARGYLRRPGLTAERFLPDPFSDAPGMRMYKTNDLARYLSDGNLEYLGRIDHQVKIRGFRVELGEIETVLTQHPAVQTAVVTLITQPSSESQSLVGYFVAREDPAPTSNELRNFLKQKLPEYMVPSAFMQLAAISLTPSGKIDRRALPKPDMAQFTRAQTYCAPCTPTEEQLAAIWADVLGLEKVGIHDNFFELGGHSLQAMRLISKIIATMKQALPIKTIFSHPTVEMMAQALNDLAFSKRESTANDTVPSKQERGEDLLPQQSIDMPSYLRMERRSLLSLFSIGELGRVDSAALGYLDNTNPAHQTQLRDWFNDIPLLTEVLETTLGRIALICLPLFESELYTERERLITAIIKSLKMAQHIGARVVSLPGLIPSATDYGLALTQKAKTQHTLPAISTGHGTTTAAVVMMIEKILKEGGRDLMQERVGVLGLGSIGTASLRLMLKSLPHPREIVLCDLYSKQDSLEEFKREIVAELGFQGPIHLAQSETQAPTKLYEATLIIGATNVPGILDIARVNPGTLIVDDSAPHCFDSTAAIERFEKHADILFTEGGVLKSPHPIQQISYIPPTLTGVLDRYSPQNVFAITGCVLSSLLSAQFENLKPTVGLVQLDASLQHHQKLHQLEFEAVDLHCDTYTLDRAAIRRFRHQLGYIQRGDKL